MTPRAKAKQRTPRKAVVRKKAVPKKATPKRKKAAPKRKTPTSKGGRPEREFTRNERESVKWFAICGVPQAKIAEIMECALETLRKHCKRELEVGKLEANSIVANHLFRNATSGNVTAQIFWLKTNAKWSEHSTEEGPQEVPPGLTINLHPSSGTDGS